MSDLVAQRRAYALLGTLLLDGVNEARLETVRALPGLGPVVDPEQSLDELAVAHHELFGRQVPPLAGAFVDAEGLVGAGPMAAAVRKAHTLVGREPDQSASLDHVGQGLLALTRLVDAQLDATEHGATKDRDRLVHAQRHLLDEALLPWMPPLWAAVSQQPTSLWTAAVELVVGLLAAHRERVGGPPIAGPRPEPPDDLAALLDDRSTGLRSIARALATPARVGLWLAHREIDGLATACELPGGFGSRVDRLDKLLRAAAEYERLGALCEHLNGVVDAHVSALDGPEHLPAFARVAAPWKKAMAATQRGLQRLRAAVSC